MSIYKNGKEKRKEWMSVTIPTVIHSNCSLWYSEWSTFQYLAKSTRFTANTGLDPADTYMGGQRRCLGQSLRGGTVLAALPAAAGLSASRVELQCSLTSICPWHGFSVFKTWIFPLKHSEELRGWACSSMELVVNIRGSCWCCGLM